MRSSVKIEALKRAAEILGGRPQLRSYLKVSAMCLGLWISGATTLPDDDFLRLVDLIVDAEVAKLKSRDGK